MKPARCIKFPEALAPMARWQWKHLGAYFFNYHTYEDWTNGLLDAVIEKLLTAIILDDEILAKKFQAGEISTGEILVEALLEEEIENEIEMTVDLHTEITFAQLDITHRNPDWPEWVVKQEIDSQIYGRTGSKESSIKQEVEALLANISSTLYDPENFTADGQFTGGAEHLR